MYEVVGFSILEIVMIFIIFLAAGLLTFPITRLLFTAIERGTKKWR